MKILFSVSSFGFLRNFQSTIRLLAERGHAIHLIAERTDAIDGQKMVDSLKADHPSIEYEFVPSSRHRLWYALGTGVRAALDYWRYLDAALGSLAEAAAPRRRTGARLCGGRSASLPVLGTRAGRALLIRLFHAIDRVLPPPAEVTDVFRRIQPDLMLLTPLLYFRSHQVDHVRSARAARDQIDSRRRQLGSPDDEGTHSRSARPRARLERGAEARGDRAARRARRSRARDRRAGVRPLVLDAAVGRSGRRSAGRYSSIPSRPFLLYLCSSPFIAPQEVGFVRRWIAAIRASADPRLRTAGLLVRPHPQNWRQWQDVDLAAEFDNVAFWPKTGREPDRRRRAQRLLRLHLPLRGGRRREHERDDRVRHHRPSGVHGAGGGIRRHAGRHAAFPAPEERRRRARVPGRERSTNTPRSSRSMLNGDGAERLRARGFIQGVHPSARPRRRCDAAGRRRDRTSRGRRRAGAGAAVDRRARACARALVPAAVARHRDDDGAGEAAVDRAALDAAGAAGVSRVRVAADLCRPIRQAAAAPAVAAGVALSFAGCSFSRRAG